MFVRFQFSNGNLSLALFLHEFTFIQIGPSLIFSLFNVVISRDPSEEKIVEDFLVKEGVDESIKTRILSIIKGMGKQSRSTFCYCYMLEGLHFVHSI